MVVELANGCTNILPPGMAQELHGADPADLAEIQIDGVGFNLHWPRLDANLAVPATVAGVFGTKAWMAKQWAKAAGETSTSAKAAAAWPNVPISKTVLTRDRTVTLEGGGMEVVIAGHDSPVRLYGHLGS